MSEVALRTTGGLELLAQLETSGALTSTSLVLPIDLPWDQYEALAFMLGQLHRSTSWAIGDLLLHGEKIYGETYTQVAALTGLNETTLMNYVSVCKHIPRARRHASLPFSVHAEVAYKEPAEQQEWLQKAAEHGWTRAELRLAMRGENALQAPGEAPEVEVLPPMVGSLVSMTTARLLQGLRTIYDQEGVTLWLAHAIEQGWPMQECLQRVDAMASPTYV